MSEQRAMSTASQIARARAAAGTRAGAGANDLATRLAATEWSLLMKVKLQARRLWEAVHVGGISYDDDRRALEALCATVPTELGASLANKAMAKLAWEAIAMAHVRGDRVR